MDGFSMAVVSSVAAGCLAQPPTMRVTTVSVQTGSATPPPASPSTAPAPGGGISPENAALAARITPESISAPTRYLASDLLEGRGPGSRGDQLAMEYIATELGEAGYKPGGDGGTFFQNVPLVGVKAVLPRAVTAHGNRGSQQTLNIPEDLVVISGRQEPDVTLPSAPLVFVGYGIVAPEQQWDDYKDVDVRGKIVVVMNNDPSSDPTLFAGKTRLWYGRYDYKYLQAARKGAVGCILVHTTPSAGYPYQVVVASNAREKFELPAEGSEPRLAAKMWMTEDAAKKLVALGGDDLDNLRSHAESRSFHPVQLSVTLGLRWKNQVRKVETANVVGVLPGSDAELAKEAVVYTAHHDHFGIGAPKNGDSIYNGAVDNASGVGALLSIAHAIAEAPRTRRTTIINSVAAEEQGLLGSEYYARHPTFPPGRLAADLNLDMMNVSGATSDLGSIGLGKSSLDPLVVEVARGQGRTVHGDAFPDLGMYYRSDQFSFAKVGVPGLYVVGGPGFVGKPPGWGEARKVEYDRTRYHQPSDELDPSWDWTGAVQDTQLVFLVGRRVANADAMPFWKPTDEFAKVPRAR
jgi:Zn-dependent M28 family amino/carboxypeptidase